MKIQLLFPQHCSLHKSHQSAHCEVKSTIGLQTSFNHLLLSDSFMKPWMHLFSAQSNVLIIDHL